MIYLDYAATTPLDKKVLQKMQPYFSREFANPASIHSPGQAALKAVEDARHSIANLLDAKASELVFTSGATEANNLALRGVLKNLRQKGDTRRHLITLATEHDSVLETLHDLELAGYKIERLTVTKQGLLDLKKLEKAITKETALVSIAFVNSETGVIQAIDRIGRLIRNINERRYKLWLNTSARARGEKPRAIYFHSDATQAFNCLECNVQHLKVDMLSLSAHKVYGPKGVGLLYIKKDTPMYAQQYGGHQERNMRSGTLNVPGIIGFAEALNIAHKQRKQVTATLTKLHKTLAKDILKLIPGAIIASDLNNSVPSHLNVLFPPLEGDALLSALDELGLAVSTGSACASGDLEASHVLINMGYSETMAHSAIRCSLGRLTTVAEIKKTAQLIKKAYDRCLKYS